MELQVNVIYCLLPRLAWSALTLYTSGAPNDSFLSDPLKRYFKLSGVPLKLCRFILGRAIIFLSVRSFQGNLNLFEITRVSLSISRKP